MTDDVSSEVSSNEDEEFDPKVRWVIPQRLDQMTFVGRDVLAVAHDLYVLFLDLRSAAEAVYVADGAARGDGVDVLAGHKGSLFAFAEKVNHARIFIVMYPSFTIVAELKDGEVNRYKGLCMMEGDLVAGFSGFPHYLVSVWSWRSGQRLLSLPTGVRRRNQIYTASRLHTLVCECWGDGLAVWEVAPCYRRCLALRRATGPGAAAPPAPLVAVCWAADGALYALDPEANLYAVTSDGIAMVTVVEWSSSAAAAEGGAGSPSLCALGGGLLVCGPDHQLRWLKKAEQAWRVAWAGWATGWATGAGGDPVVRLVGSAAGDAAAAWTRAGRVLRLAPDGDRLDMRLVAFKQRDITRVQLLAPRYEHVATLSAAGALCVYELRTATLVSYCSVEGEDVQVAASPTEPLLGVVGAAGAGAEPDYGLALLRWSGGRGLARAAAACLTHQAVSRVAFSPTGRELVAAAMAAGHVFIYKVSPEARLTLVRYAELGRGLADCFLMPVGGVMRAFSLVLFSDKYAIGERIVCVNAETGKDNKFAGKMQGPYAGLLPLSAKDCMLAVPHLSRHFHVLRLSGEKGITVSVKMGPIVDSGHELRRFRGFRNVNALLTYGADGAVILRHPDGRAEHEWKLTASHRYEGGVAEAVVDARNRWVVHVAAGGTLAATSARAAPPAPTPPPTPPDPALFDDALHTIKIIDPGDKNYLELQEEKKVREESLDHKTQRDEVVRTFGLLQRRLVALLEENIRERPLHQLSLAEFNLHLEAKKERLKQAEREREDIRLQTEARIRAQDKVTAWIKSSCWDAMLTPRVKLLAIFSHYQVENYPVLPTQRDLWPELQQTEALRAVEMENDADLFKPWEELSDAPPPPPPDRRRTGAGGGASTTSVGDAARDSQAALEMLETDDAPEGEPYVLSGSSAHKFITIPPFMIPQTLSFSFLQMNWLHHIVKLNAQNMRLWFNKQFDELMAQKRREVGLVGERNARLRFVVEELNKLSDLRLSFHHLLIVIKDPEWAQDEEPYKLIKVEPEECSIAPYVSPSQVVVPPPEPRPKDDFRERALNDMMDGVLEKLWHEEIKKPIPKPQCMLDKEPEHLNEEELRQVFEYEAKVAFRNEERDKYRKMLHAEYGRLAHVLSEGVLKFNLKVKDMWLTKLRVDSVIGQENLNLMRLRRANLDRLEAAEQLEFLRGQVSSMEGSVEALQRELALVAEQGAECQAAYDALAQRDRHMDRTFKNNFADMSPIVVEQCYKFFKRRPKWHQRATMTPGTLYELAGGVLAGARPPLLHHDCQEYFKAVDQLDQISNMPPVMDEGLWTTMCRLRRAKIDNEIRMRAVVLETGHVEAAGGAWGRALAARRARLAAAAHRVLQHRDLVERAALDRTLQLVVPAGQVEIATSGHMEDFEDASLIPREDIDTINNLILRVGAIKLRMMRKQMEFRKVILAKEWEHAQMKMKLRHMQQELYSYCRLRIPKELQWYLKGKEQGYTDEMDHQRLEKEMAATKMSFNMVLGAHVQRVEELEVRLSAVEAATAQMNKLVATLNVRVSEKRLKEDPLEPIRIRRLLTNRMETLVARSRLVREVQAHHSALVLLHTELELLRLKTYPTLATFNTFC